MSTFQTPIDRLLSSLGHALVTVSGRPHAGRPCPEPMEALETDPAGSEPLSEADKKLAGALMRVNHVGEVCAQALYAAQAEATADPKLRQHFLHASQEETDHLAWTEQRLSELGGRTSVFNPLWYAGAFAIGWVAGKAGGDKVSLGFVVETEQIGRAHV